MSHDAWGGGSDEDPKLRVKELNRLKGLDELTEPLMRWRKPYVKKKPAVSVFDALAVVITLVALFLITR